MRLTAFRFRLAAALLPLALAACESMGLPGSESDGGSNNPDLATKGNPDLATNACGTLASEIKSWLDGHHACKADSDCVALPMPCAFGAYSCYAIVNSQADSPNLKSQVADFESRCDTADCACPALYPQPSCNAGVCGPRLAGTGAVGDACRSGADCTTGQCATPNDDPGFVDGYCTILDCDPMKPVCPSDSQCKPIGNRYYCLANCGGFVPNPRQCRSGYGCCTGPGPVYPDEPGQCAPEKSSYCLAR